MSNLATVIAIVPRLPPAIDGVGDYALNLARQLRKDFNIHTHFIVGNSTWQGAAEIEGFTISQITDNSANILVNVLSNYHSSSPVLLHYVGYGYAKRGCPVWLVDGLQRWKGLYPKSNLVTMFHEISASGPPWTSAFWLSSLQKDLAARLTKLSDHGWTSMEQTSKLLEKITHSQHCPIFRLPVFSTIGECEIDQVSPLSKRQQKLVIFGTYGRRLPIYQNSLHILRQIVRDLEIKEILDIGKPLTLSLKEIDDVPIVTLGEQPSSNIYSILQSSIAGVIDYPAAFLAKSTILAAYCTCGTLPIVLGTDNVAGEIDGLIAGKHYWLPTPQPHSLNMEIAQDISSNAYNWYQDHNLSVHAKTLITLLLK
jgi:hypothetical protein